ncbi:hypothetical protein STEG23_021447 [Scotinomys teguina]
MQPDRATNNSSRTMEVVAAAPRCQLLLIVLMAAMLLPGMKVSPLLIWRKIARTIELQENIGKGCICNQAVPFRVPQRGSCDLKFGDGKLKKSVAEKAKGPQGLEAR